MKKIFFAAFAVATIGLTGYNVIESIQTAKLSDLSLKNIEALSNDENNPNEIPKYINKTEIRNREETKVEINKDGLKIEYKRTCCDVITYCENTGEDSDICYTILNQIETTCGSWD